MDKVYYHKDFDENHSILLDETEIDGQAMFIFVDKFGNEFVTTRGEKIIMEYKDSDLVLEVSKNVNPAVWDEGFYSKFL